MDALYDLLAAYVGPTMAGILLAAGFCGLLYAWVAFLDWRSPLPPRRRR